MNSNKKLLTVALLGSTGGTGVETLQQLLDRGHVVRTLVRSPEKILTQHENLKVIKSNIYDYESLKDGFEGCDIVMSCLGTTEIAEGTSFYRDTMQVIARAMRDNNISRIITMTSWGTYRDPRSPCFINYVARYFIGSILDSMRHMELYMENECSDLEYTIVRPPGLGHSSLTGRNVDTALDCPCVPKDGCCTTNFRMQRSDVAKFMIDCAETGDFMKRIVSIAIA